MLINAGIRRVVYLEGYPDHLSMDIHEAGIEVVPFTEILIEREAGGEA